MASGGWWAASRRRSSSRWRHVRPGRARRLRAARARRCSSAQRAGALPAPRLRLTGLTDGQVVVQRLAIGVLHAVEILLCGQELALLANLVAHGDHEARDAEHGE